MHEIKNYANAATLTVSGVTVIDLMDVSSDALIMMISPVFINVDTLLKYPDVLIAVMVSFAE